MLFRTEDEKKYPQWTTFVKTALTPKALETSHPKVWKSYLKACTAPTQINPAQQAEKFAREALTAGPLVNIYPGLIPRPGSGDLMCGSEDLQPRVFAQNKSWTEIYVTSWWATMYEECAGDVRARTWTQCTLLHELVHWTRTKADATGQIFLDSDDEALAMGTQEAGEVFELWAYGERQCTNANITTAKNAILGARVQSGWKDTLDFMQKRKQAGADTTQLWRGFGLGPF